MSMVEYCCGEVLRSPVCPECGRVVYKVIKTSVKQMDVRYEEQSVSNYPVNIPEDNDPGSRFDFTFYISAFLVIVIFILALIGMFTVLYWLLGA